VFEDAIRAHTWCLEASVTCVPPACLLSGHTLTTVIALNSTKILKGHERCRIQSISFTESNVSIPALQFIMGHPLTELNLMGCMRVDGQLFSTLHTSTVGTTLRRLSLNGCRGIPTPDFEDRASKPGLSAVPNLTHLDLGDTAIEGCGLACVPKLLVRLVLVRCASLLGGVRGVQGSYRVEIGSYLYAC
jgi:hypothetical protein